MAAQDVQHALLRTPSQAGDGHVNRVLVAFDGSPPAWAALHQGISVAVSNHARLTIAAVVHEPSAFWMGFGAMTVPCTRDSLRRDLEREMRRHLAEARDEVPATVSVTTQILHGRPWRAIAELAESGGYDLVVTGRRPLGRRARLLRHSVARHVLLHARVSVLAVTPQ